ncbi:hypothetical protein QYE76_007396 [Lolium multiflorum]|uniref:Peptidase A2 domain-containing protein n=1 Tax=Lolium multiflorum TaxID=4521 RepID=A0AAD8RWR9_LOLMU|nr:hypothetical protein QYE76_007396 [Lolium multiflorum]
MSKAADEVVGEPVTYADLPEEQKKKYDEMKAILEADLIGSFVRTRSHGVRWKGFSPEGVLDGVDLSTPSEERTRALRQEINYMAAHSLHRYSESLVNTLERVAVRVVQEIMKHQYSPSGPTLGTHQGEVPLQIRPPLPFALPEPPVHRIQVAIEQGRLLFGQFAMKVDTHPFPGVNMVEPNHSARRRLDFSFDVNMAGPVRHHGKDKEESSHSRNKEKEEADPRDRPRYDDKRYLTKEQVRSVRYQKPLSTHLLNKRRKKDAGEVSVFKRLGPLPPQNKRAESSQDEDFEESEDEEEDRYHRPRCCPDGLIHSQKRRVQRLRSLEQAEARYLHTLRKARPDLAVKIQQTLDEETRPPKKVWRPKRTRADADTSAGTNMVFFLPSEFRAPGMEEVPIAQFDCGPRPVIFEKPREKGYKHMKALYLKGYINGQPVGRMLVDTGAAVNIMPYSMLRRLGRSSADLIKTNVTLNDFNGQASGTQGVLNVDLTVGRKTIPTTFFIVDSKSTYVVLLGRDWIHAMCCIPSTMHQCDGKLGYGFTSADELEEIDIGPGDKPRPTFISKKLDPHLRGLMIALLKEYPDCFAWDYTEMPGLDRSIIEHRLPLKKGFRPFQQRARQMKAKILEEVKKEIEKMLRAGFIRPCRYAEWISSIVPVEKKDVAHEPLRRMSTLSGAETLINAAAGHKV